MIKQILLWKRILLFFVLFVFLLHAVPVYSQVKVTLPRIEIDNKSTGEKELSTSIQLLLLLTAISMAPAFLLLLTSFTRIVIVLSFVRTALSINQTPPNQVIIGLALFLTFFVMAPTWHQVNDIAIKPYMSGEISYNLALDKGLNPIRDFMFRQTQEKDLALMIQMAKMEKPKNETEVPTYVLIPAFVISELSMAFRMGFMLFIPFIVIDMVISSILLSMGMMMLPPVMISLPFKILLFVMADGWRMIVKSLVVGFN
ncbi:flagellar type III secretion system pore protein FliP [Candidatus Gottesmanbacteria bacterium]|nr:flagellar type III secretion system pore protein FliP [Candidatus Gottesmanbacteria bacterium]